MKEKNSSLALVKLFIGTFAEVEEKLCAFYLQMQTTLEEAKENTKFILCNDGICVAAVYYKQKIPVI